MKIRSGVAACVGIALLAMGSAHAAKGDRSPLLRQVNGPGQLVSLNSSVISPKGRGAVTGVSVAGINSVDGIDSPNNVVLNLNIGAGNQLLGLSWDVGLQTVGASWLSEAVVQFSDSTGSADPEAINLTVGIGQDASGNMEFSSGGVILFSSVPLPPIPAGPDGILRLQFFEDFDDAAGPDANWRNAAVPAVIAGLGLACSNQAACDAALGGSLSLGTVTAADSCLAAPANNNGVLEPGELVNFTVPVNANGGAFTNVVGTLTTGTAGVTIVNGVGNYGNIASGGSGSASYSIRLDRSIACFSALNLTLAVTSTEGNYSFPISRNIGQAAITYTGLPLNVPDNNPTGASSTASVTGMTGPIAGVQVAVNMTHTWVGDVTIRLTSPGGTVLTLLDRPGVPASAAGCNNNNINATFQDGGPNPEAVCDAAGSAAAWPVTVAAPVNAFSGLNGQTGNGTWTLTVSDSATLDTGTVGSWTLTLTPAPSGVCTVCPPSADLSLTLTDAPDPVTAGTNLTYTAVVTNAGPDPADAVTVTLPLPANTTFVSGSVDGAGGSCAGSPVVCSVTGSIPAGGSRTATITVQVAAAAPNGSTINATATAATTTLDTNGANNSASTSTLVATSADLQVALTPSTTTVAVNVPVTFTATSTNLGPSDAQNVVVSVSLAPDFRYTSHVAAGATCTTPQVGNSGVVTCTWAGGTAPNAVRTLEVVAYSNNERVNSVSASTTSTTPDPVLTNNNASVSVQVGELVTEIPTLGRNALLLLGMLLALGSFVAIRRNS